MQGPAATHCVGGIRNTLSCASRLIAASLTATGLTAIELLPENRVQGCRQLRPARFDLVDLSSLTSVYLTVSGNNSAASGRTRARPASSTSTTPATNPTRWTPVGGNSSTSRVQLCVRDAGYVLFDSATLAAVVVMWDRCVRGHGFKNWATTENPHKSGLLANPAGTDLPAG